MRQLSLLLLVLVGCGNNSSVGSPCDKDDQCSDGLVCDFHDGKGTCQEPHGHGSAGETQDGSSGGASSTHEPTSGTTHDHATGGHGPTAGTTGSVEEVCADYCVCLQMHCTSHDQFPHADVAACEAACAGFSAEESACWIPYCALAAKGDNSQEHYCEHASGAVGLAECE
jgi:hypothetical protein